MRLINYKQGRRIFKSIHLLLRFFGGFSSSISAGIASQSVESTSDAPSHNCLAFLSHLYSDPIIKNFI